MAQGSVSPNDMAQVAYSPTVLRAAARVAVAVCLLAGAAQTHATPIIPVAEANGPYVFDAAHLTLPLDSTGSHDPGGGSLVAYNWTAAGAVLGGPAPSLGLVDSGLAATTDSNSVSLVVTNDLGEPSDPDVAAIAYANTAPVVTAVSTVWGGKAPDVLLEFIADYHDTDFVVNPLIGAFERTSWEFDTAPAAGAAEIGDGFLAVWGDLNGGARREMSLPQLLTLFGPGTHTIYFNVADRAGQVASMPLQFALPDPDPLPEPGTLVVSLTALLALGLRRRRRR